MKKLYKKIEQENGTMHFYGANRYAELKHLFRFEDSSFIHYGRTYRLSEFMRIDSNCPEWLQEFDGYMSDSFFSGVVIKLSDCGDAVKAFTYIC